MESRDMFQGAQHTHRRWIDTQKRRLGWQVKAAHPTRGRSKASKRKASEEAMASKRKKKHTALPPARPNDVRELRSTCMATLRFVSPQQPLPSLLLPLTPVIRSVVAPFTSAGVEP